MALSASTKLGPYEVLSAIGTGGMGEVYRARDTRLGRDVAVKVLREQLSSNPDLKARFEREAKAISALNHPHICHLYDVGSQGGADYLVMELLEGETLADRLQKGALPQEQVLRVGAEVASALDAAHHSGVVHRDLKPGNIMLTKSGAKLMDFGVAKPVAGLAAAASHLTPTVSKPLTAAGTIVGTYQYMAPEQIEGKEADPRTDIFALGSVLYEMATGRRAFEGKSQLSVVSAILEKEPEPITRIRPLMAPALEHVVSTCLAKAPAERWQTAADVARELRWISHSSAQISAVHRRPPRTKWLVAAVAGGALLIAAFISLRYWETRAMVPVNYEFYVPAPEKATLHTLGLAGSPVISPDGKEMAFLATNPEGVRSLWIRALDSPDPRLLPETENATFPFWSPDSKQVGFFANGKMLRIASHGGVPIPVCSVSEGRGGAWSEKGFIVFGTRDGPLYRVPAVGGKPIALTQLDNAKGEGSHRFPALLPHDDHFVFVAQSNHTELVAGSLQFGRRLADFPDISASVAYNDGSLLFVRGSTLFAQSFDPQRLEFKGDPLVVAEKVESDSQFNFSILSVSSNGTLIFQSGTTGSNKQLFLLDRSGKQIGVLPGSGTYVTVHLSPSSNQLLVDVAEGAPNKRAIWLYDLVAGTRTRVTFNDESTEGLWSHDGQKIAFDVGAQAEPHVRDLVTGSETTLFSVPGESVVTDWSPDDRYLLDTFHGTEAVSRYEVWAVSTTGQHNRYPLLQVAQDFPGPRLSPDGKWLAYSGYETGRPEIYIVPIDFGGPQPKIGTNKWQISTDGGVLPVWSRDGKELFFTNVPETTLYSVPLTMTEGVVRPGTIKKLFDLSTHANAFFYDVSPDGKRFYVAEAPQGSSPPLTVVTNWQARVKK